MVEMSNASTRTRQKPPELAWPFGGRLNLGRPVQNRGPATEPAGTRPKPPTQACLDLRSPSEPAEFQSGARQFWSRCLTQFVCFGTLTSPHPPGTRRNPRRNLPKNTTGPQRDTILVRKRRPGTRRNPLRNPRFFGDAPRDLPVSWCHTGTLLYYY